MNAEGAASRNPCPAPPHARRDKSMAQSRSAVSQMFLVTRDGLRPIFKIGANDVVNGHYVLFCFCTVKEKSMASDRNGQFMLVSNAQSYLCTRTPFTTVQFKNACWVVHSALFPYMFT